MSRRREFAGLLLRYFYSLACRTSHSRHVYTHREKSLIFVTQQSLREWQFSFTVTRRRQNHILFRQPHKQVALQLAEGTIRFHPQLLFMFAFQNSNAEGAAMRLQNHTWSAWMTQDHLVLHLFMHRVVGVLTSPLHVLVWAPTKYLLSRNILSAAVNNWQRKSVSLVTHAHRNTVTIPTSVLFLIMLTEHQNMIYMKLQTASLPATVTSTRSHVFRDWQMNCLNNMEEEKFLGCTLFPKLVTDTKQNDMSAMFRLSCSAAQCDMVPPSVKWSCAVWHGSAQCDMIPRSVKWSRSVWNGLAQCEMVPRSWTFLLKTLLEAAIFLVVLNFIVWFK